MCMLAIIGMRATGYGPYLLGYEVTKDLGWLGMSRWLLMGLHQLDVLCFKLKICDN